MSGCLVLGSLFLFACFFIDREEKPLLTEVAAFSFLVRRTADLLMADGLIEYFNNGRCFLYSKGGKYEP